MSDDDDDRTRVVTQPSSLRPDEAPTIFAGSSLPAGFVLGDFQIEKVIGVGGFSIVYLARDRQLHRHVALKEYMPGPLAMRSSDYGITVKSDRLRETFSLGLRSFVNEARILARFDHPALVKVLRYWEDHGTAYMAMPFYEGVTLKQAMQQPGFEPTQAWLASILTPLFDAIELLHSANCFHRDIAPDNILVLQNGAPLLLDFGAARHVIGDMTQALTAILKPGYAPIEQYAETASIRQGPWTDIYAVSAVLYWAVTGRVPPPSVGRMMNDELRPVTDGARPGFSDRFLQGIQAGLAIKPQERPQSIAQFRALLDVAVLERPPTLRMPLAPAAAELPTAPVPVAAPPKMGRAPRRGIRAHLTYAGFALAVMAVVTILSASGLWRLLGLTGTEVEGPKRPPAAGASAARPGPTIAPVLPASEAGSRITGSAIESVNSGPVAPEVKTPALVIEAGRAVVGPAPASAPLPARATEPQAAPAKASLPATTPSNGVALAKPLPVTKEPPPAQFGSATNPADAAAAPKPRSPQRQPPVGATIGPAHAAKPTATPECADLLQRLSIGEDTPELRARLESGHCAGR